MNKPSFFRIAFTDYYASLAIIVPLVGLGIFIFTQFTGVTFSRTRGISEVDQNDPFFIYAALVACVACLPILIWRVRNISNLFESGIEADGIVTDMAVNRGRARISYRFEADGQSVDLNHMTQYTALVKTLQPGTPVTVLYDSNEPEKGFIKDIFLEK